MKKLRKIAVVIGISLLLTACSEEIPIVNNGEKRISDTDSNEDHATEYTVTLESMEACVSELSFDLELSKEADTVITMKDRTVTCEGKGAVFKEGVLTINKGGTYEITGNLTDGRIEINAGEEELVQLVLNGVNVSCSDYAPITIWQAKKTIVQLAEGTTNVFTDGGDYYEEENTEVETPSAAFYSKDDLVFTGEGTLEIEASCNDGITGKDDVLFCGGNYQIEAQDDGIVGKDYLTVKDGDFTINVKGDALKATEEEDAEKGWIAILDGSFEITAETDAIKGKNYVWIESGSYNISAGDDGIHGDHAVVINGGTIDIKTCYEGIEGELIQIVDGDIQINASDDGINAADGSSTEGMDGPRGMGGPGAMDGQGGMIGGPQPGSESGTGQLNITGGRLYVNASGDGIDSNGSISISGGYIEVDGPTNSGNGILDYGQELLMDGGTLIGTGSAGMLQTISQNSSQPAIAVVFEGIVSAGMEIVLKDKAGTELITYIPSKDASAAILSTEELVIGETYELLLDGTTYTTVEVTAVTTNVGSSGRGGMNGEMPGGAPGGIPGGGRRY